MVGDSIWAYYDLVLRVEPPFPSVADAAYLLLPIAVFCSWVLHPPEGRRAGLRILLDGVIVASALFLVFWVAVLDDLFRTSEGTRLQLAVSLAYPLLDLVMVTMALLMTANAPVRQRPIIGAFAAGLLVIAMADIASLFYRAHDSRASDPVVVGWAAGLLLIGFGAMLSIRNPQPELRMYHRTSRLMLWLPYLPLPFAVGMGIVALWPIPYAAPVLISAAVLVGAALIRQLTVLVENRSLLETVEDQALRDPLTGLANRLMFADRLTHAMHLRARDGRNVAVLSLDLDDFKLVNDDLGHPSGDAMLRAVADRLLSVVPTGDTIARLGGDEFALLIEDGPAPAEEVAQRVVEVFDKPFFLDGDEVYMHPSVGLAIAPLAADGELDADELLKRADLAMYTAKRAGVGGVQLFTFDMRHVDPFEVRAAVAGVQLLGQLRRAIDEGELCLVYQPKISLSTGGIVGVEALIRWPHPELGLLTPGQFLPLVRQNGLMGAVTDLVLTTAASDASVWYHAGQVEVPVAINLFAPSLNDLTPVSYTHLTLPTILLV